MWFVRPALLRATNSHPGWAHLRAASQAICRPSRLRFLSSFCFFSSVSSLLLTDSTRFLTIHFYSFLSIALLFQSSPRPIFLKSLTAGHSICTSGHQKAENKQAVCGGDGCHSCKLNGLQSVVCIEIGMRILVAAWLPSVWRCCICYPRWRWTG